MHMQDNCDDRKYSEKGNTMLMIIKMATTTCYRYGRCRISSLCCKHELNDLTQLTILEMYPKEMRWQKKD